MIRVSEPKWIATKGVVPSSVSRKMRKFIAHQISVKRQDYPLLHDEIVCCACDAHIDLDSKWDLDHGGNSGVTFSEIANVWFDSQMVFGGWPKEELIERLESVMSWNKERSRPFTREEYATHPNIDSSTRRLLLNWLDFHSVFGIYPMHQSCHREKSRNTQIKAA
jgi:hypothetical protein